jgi:hypothetical protein
MLSRDTCADATSSFDRRPAEECTMDCPHEAAQGRWIEIELLDDLDKPVAGERYLLMTAGGVVLKEGTLDSNGLARLDGMTEEECIVTFPDLDAATWEKKDA